MKCISLILIFAATIGLPDRAQASCQSALSAHATTRQLLELFQSGLEKESEIVGYLGLTPEAMKEIVQEGRVRSIQGISFFPISSNQYGERFLRRRLGLGEEDFSRFSRDKMLEAASRESSKMARKNLVNHRLSEKGTSQEGGRQVIWKVLECLEKNLDPGKKGILKAQEFELRACLIRLNLPPSPKFSAQVQNKLKSDSRFARSDEIWDLKSQDTEQQIAELLGPQWAAADIENLFTKLPSRSGYILAINALGLTQISATQDLRILKFPDLKGVEGIEALSDEDFQFLHTQNPPL